MAIDHVGMMRELARLRALAAAKLSDGAIPADLDTQKRIREDINSLDLQSHALDLETKGYTVLPPGVAGPPELVDALRQTIESYADEDASEILEAGQSRGRNLWHLLPRDQIFEQALMAPAPLALVAYLLGYKAKLSQFRGIVKDENSTAPFEFHAEQSRKIPTPWPADAQYATVTWALTDYTRENGATCVFPGSHKLCTDVPAALEVAHDHPEAEVVEAAAGSVIVWHGGLWHGAMPRTAKGRRVTMVMPMTRFHLLPQELFWASVTDEMIERNSSRFSALMGLVGSWPWGVDGPDTGYARPSWLSQREQRFS